MRSVVVLPQPDGPSRTTYSPCSTCRLTSSTARVPPGKTFVSPIRSSPEPLGAEGAVCAAPSSSFEPATPSAVQSLGAEEVVPPLDLVRGLGEVAVPRWVVPDGGCKRA